jgi:hypothetical protein
MRQIAVENEPRRAVEPHGEPRREPCGSEVVPDATSGVKSHVQERGNAANRGVEDKTPDSDSSALSDSP